MNCKPGDLAVIVRSNFGNEGAIVRCIAFFPAYEGRGDKYPRDAWGVEGTLKVSSDWTADDTLWCRRRGFDHVVVANRLRPIRDQPGDDETLSWAGKPQEVKA